MEITQVFLHPCEGQYVRKQSTHRCSKVDLYNCFDPGRGRCYRITAIPRQSKGSVTSSSIQIKSNWRISWWKTFTNLPEAEKFINLWIYCTDGDSLHELKEIPTVITGQSYSQEQDPKTKEVTETCSFWRALGSVGVDHRQNPADLVGATEVWVDPDHTIRLILEQTETWRFRSPAPQCIAQWFILISGCDTFLAGTGPILFKKK